MEAVLRMNALTETYIDTENLINKIAWSFYDTYGGEFDEWKAEANYLFLLAYDSYKNGKSQFSTWLYLKVWFGLIKYMKTLRKQCSSIFPNTNASSIEFVKKELPNKTTQTYLFSPLEMLDGLNTDSKTIIRLILQPKEITNKIKTGPHPCHVKKAIKKYLNNLGWTSRRIKESFKEIKEVLCA